MTEEVFVFGEVLGGAESKWGFKFWRDELHLLELLVPNLLWHSHFDALCTSMRPDDDTRICRHGLISRLWDWLQSECNVACAMG